MAVKLSNLVNGGIGVVPIGAAVALLVTTHFTPPATGEVKDGWMLCDGGAMPANAVLTGNTPILNDSRFLMAGTSVGSIGGGTATLDIPHLPSHTHPVPAHTHTVGNNSANHSHSVTGGTVAIASSGGHSHVYTRATAQQTSSVAVGSSGYTIGTWPATNTTGTGNHTHTVPNHTHTVGTQTANHNHSVTGGATTASATGSGTAFNVVPKYMSCIYLIRVL